MIGNLNAYREALTPAAFTTLTLDGGKELAEHWGLRPS
jgi:hypothetical protein